MISESPPLARIEFLNGFWVGSSGQTMADTTIHYWRTKDKAEVAFVIRKGEEVIPLEVGIAI